MEQQHSYNSFGVNLDTFGAVILQKSAFVGNVLSLQRLLLPLVGKG